MMLKNVQSCGSGLNGAEKKKKKRSNTATQRLAKKTTTLALEERE
jgi:hypothetical protein